ncbi:MAG: hypothetical protein M4579_000233 [Chaenotheca gracillima]|nr:MAG: hypothetical protein M4579_000233 [Chaenotheca gracillima]
MEYPQYPAVDRGGYQYPGNHSAQANQHELSGVAGPSRGPAANNQDRNGAIQGYIVPAASNPEDPEDYTSFIPGQERWSLWSLPPIVGQLFPSPASRGFIGDVLDQNGRPATDPQTGKRLKDYPFLPRKISTKVEGWRLETWCRMDSRVNIDDFHARMVPRNRPTGNVINMRRRRFREDHTVLAWKSRRNVPSKIELQTLQRLHHDQIECNTQWSIVEIHGTGALGIQQPRTSEGEPPVAPDILPYNYFPVIMHDSRLRLQGIQRELARLREIAEREGVEDWKKLDPIHFHSSWGDRNHEQRRKTMAAKRSREDSDGSDSEWSARPQKRRRISATPPQVKREKKRREPARIRKTAHAESGPSSNHAIQSGDARTQRLGHDNVGNNPVEQRTNVENNFAVNHGQDFGQRVSQADQSQDSVPYMTGAINQTQRPSDLPNLLDNGRQGGMPLEDFTQQITDYAAELPQDQDINEEELHHGMNWGQWISTRGRSEYQQFLQFDNMSFSAWILEHAGDAYRRYFATTERGRSHARNVEAMFSNGDQPNAPAANRAGASLGDQSSTLVGHGAAASSTAQSNAAIGTSDDFSNSINSNHSSGNGAQEDGFQEAPHSAPPHIERMPILAEEQPPLPLPLHTAVPTIANSNDTSELMLPTLPVLPEIPNLGGLIQRRPTSSAINPEQRPGSFSLDLSPGGLEFDIGDWMNESRLRTTSELNAQEQGSDPSNGSERIPAPTAEAETDGNVLPSVETSSIHDVVPADDTTVKPEEQNDRRPRGISDISSLGELLNVPIYPEGSDNGSSQLSNSEDVPASSPPLSQATISQRRPNAPSFGSILPQSRNLVNEATERRAGHFDGGNTVDNRMQQTTNHAQNLQHIQEPFAEQSSYADRPQVSQFSHHHAGSLYNIPFEPVNHNEVAPEIQQTQSVGGTSRVPQAQVSRPDSKKPQQQTPTGNTANGSHEPHTANGNQIMADFFAYNEVDYPLSPEPSHRLPEVETGINQNHETDRQEEAVHLTLLKASPALPMAELANHVNMAEKFRSLLILIILIQRLPLTGSLVDEKAHLSTLRIILQDLHLSQISMDNEQQP